MAGDWDEHPSDAEPLDVSEEYVALQERINQSMADSLMATTYGTLRVDVPPSDIDVAVAVGWANYRRRWMTGMEFTPLAERRENDLKRELRFQAIPGGLEIGSPVQPSAPWSCGCETTREGRVVERCLQHYRDALYYRNKINAMRRATATGTQWPVDQR